MKLGKKRSQHGLYITLACPLKDLECHLTYIRLNYILQDIPRILEDEVVTRITHHHGKTPAQVFGKAMCWHPPMKECQETSMYCRSCCVTWYSWVILWYQRLLNNTDWKRIYRHSTSNCPLSKWLNWIFWTRIKEPSIYALLRETWTQESFLHILKMN